MILVIDNYDSFTYNLVQYMAQLEEEVVVHRNDRLSLEEIDEMDPAAIVLSPGPRTPREAGISVNVIKRFHVTKPILGVCLGHQVIGYAFGGEIVRAERIMHGKTSQVQNDGRTIFKGLPATFTAGRYHSLIINRASIPSCLEITAETGQGEVMGIRHREYPTEGIQFHPESILTPSGKRIMKNFISLVQGVTDERAEEAIQ